MSRGHSWTRLAARVAAPALLALFVAGLSALPYFRSARGVRVGPAVQGEGSRAEAPRTRDAHAAVLTMPMLFESNDGQADPDVKFISRGDDYALALTPDEARFTIYGQGAEAARPESDAAPTREPRTSPRASVLSMRLVNADRAPAVAGGKRASGHVNYFIGRGPRGRITNVPVFESVVYDKVYPGIDLVYYGGRQQLEYDFRVAPGATPAAIEMSFGGADRIEMEDGELLIQVGGRRLVQKRPRVYQGEGGGRVEVAGRYVRRGEASVGFEVGNYDASKPLVIDPVLSYATYNISALDIKFDPAGNLYVIGGVRPVAPPNDSGRDVLVSKFAPNSSGGLDALRRQQLRQRAPRRG